MGRIRKQTVKFEGIGELNCLKITKCRYRKAEREVEHFYRGDGVHTLN